MAIKITTPTCVVCNETEVLTVTDIEYAAYNAGLGIEGSFPDRDDDFRELIISGTHPQCWDEMFSEEE